jgi:tetratricopeptide (TPR) repeat protein
MIWRRAKIAATDVASVGNASDTLVPLPAATGTTNPMLPSVASPHCCTGRDLHESAKTWLNAGQYHKALTAFQAILKAQIQRFETLEHASVGAALHNVGVCYQRLEQFQKAKDVLQQAVEIRTNTLGEDHLEVAASLIKLGATKARLQELDDAFDDILLAIRIAKDNLGREHKTIAQMYCHLACFYYEANQLHAAQATFMEAYELYRIVWPKSSSISTATNNNNNGRDQLMQQMCDTLCNIGSIQNKRQQYDHAVLTFTEALALQRNSFEQQQQQHQPRILATLDNLAYSYSKMKDYKKALECYKNMLQAQLMTIDDDDKHLTTTASMHTLKKQLLMYDKLKDRKGAMQAANTTLQIAKKKKLESMVQQVEALIQERRWSSVPDKKN